MANTFNAITTGTGGISTTGDSTGAFSFTKDGGSAEVYIDASGNVGIGTSSPTGKLNAVGNIRTTATTGSNYYEFGADTTGGYIYTAQATAMQIWTNNTEKMRVTANGGIAFSGASNYGTSGQILQSNGDAAPTWVAAPSPTTANVLAATAGASVGAVGTYVMAYDGSGTKSAGSTVAGSGLYYTNCAGVNLSLINVGTWRLMGSISNSSTPSQVSLWLRIS